MQQEIQKFADTTKEGNNLHRRVVSEPTNDPITQIKGDAHVYDFKNSFNAEADEEQVDIIFRIS